MVSLQIQPTQKETKTNMWERRVGIGERKKGEKRKQSGDEGHADGFIGGDQKDFLIEGTEC